MTANTLWWQNSDDGTATAKHENIGSGPPVKESDSCSEVDLILFERQVLALNVGGDVGDPSKEEFKHSERYTNGNSPTNPRLRPIYFHDTFHVDNKPSAAEPDFGAPNERAAHALVPRPKPEMVIPGGPGRPHSTYGKHNKTVRRAPDRPPQSSSPVKHFDLTTPYVRQSSVDQGTEQSPKRRKLMATPGSPDESADDILYERTRNTAASARPTKTVASGIPPPERKHLGKAYEVPEYKKVEATVSVNNPRRRPDGRRSSTQSSREGTMVLDDGDEIQDSDLEIPKLPEPYKGTANLAPARRKEERDAKNLGMRTDPSVRLPSSSLKSRGLVASGGDRRNLDIANGSRQERRGKLRTVDGGPRASFDSNSDDELSMDKPGPGSKKTVMSHFARSPTLSMSRDGDIPSCLPRKKTIGKAGKSSSEDRPRFPVKYLRSASHVFTPIEGDKPCYLQYNPKTSRMDMIMGNLNVSEDDNYSSFTFNTTSVKKITYSTENSKVALLVRESSTVTGSLPSLLVQVDMGAIYNFVTFLQARSGAEADDQDGDKLDRIFNKTSEEYYKIRRRSETDDLYLLTQKRQHRHQERVASLTRDGKRPGNFDTSIEPRAKKLHERFKNGSVDDETGRPEGDAMDTKRSRERSKELGEESQLHRFGRTGHDNDNRPTTRSTRGQNREIRIRTPSPQRYTREHLDWRTYWAGGDEPLVFPLEGTNKATVDMRDIERLDEGEYLNDNLIAFYLRYLQEKCERDRPDVFKRVFFMNTFFYPRLTSGKGRKNIDYDAVKRWTSKVNIFDYDYVVVPVNELNHWYVAIICNVRKLLLHPEERVSKEEKQVDEKDVVDLGYAGDATNPAQPTSKHKEGSVTPDMARKVSRLSIEDRVSPEPQPNGAHHIDVERINPRTPSHTSTADDDTDRPQGAASSATKGRKGKRKSMPPVRKYNIQEPRIITLDSLATSHSPTCSNLRDFLIAEAKEKLGVEIILAQPSIGMTAKNIPLQDNFCDCGLFLLGYVEGFLDHPDETIHGIMQGSMDMANSFPKMNASDMRGNMRDLIYKLRREQIKKERADKMAKKTAKKSEKAKGEQLTSESKNVSSASTSPKAPKLEAKTSEEPASTSGTKEVLKPHEEVVNVIEEEQPKKEPESTPVESATIDSFLDDLSGYNDNEAKDKKPTDSPPNTSASVEELPKKADGRAIRDKTPTGDTNSTKSKYFKVKTKGQRQKFPSPDRNRQTKDAEAPTVSPSTPPPRQARQQLRSSSQNLIDIPTSSSEDSLRANMSPSITRGRKATPKVTDEIQDSQGDDAERGGGRNVGKGKSVEDLTDSPRSRAGEAAMKRQRELTEGQKKKSGAGGVFGGTKEKGRKKDPVVVDGE